MNSHIHIIRDQPVLLDRIVADAFGVETKHINQAVARNQLKFTNVHCFRVTSDENEILKSQSVTPKTRGGARNAYGLHSKRCCAACNYSQYTHGA